MAAQASPPPQTERKSLRAPSLLPPSVQDDRPRGKRRFFKTQRSILGRGGVIPLYLDQSSRVVPPPPGLLHAPPDERSPPHSLHVAARRLLPPEELEPTPGGVPPPVPLHHLGRPDGPQPVLRSRREACGESPPVITMSRRSERVGGKLGASCSSLAGSLRV